MEEILEVTCDNIWLVISFIILPFKIIYKFFKGQLPKI